MNSNTIRISSILPISEANGPGPHYTIWFQGCSLRCPGCFNPHTHNMNEGTNVSVSTLIKGIEELWKLKKIIGVTLTGGEPLDQIKGLVNLIKGIKKIGRVGIVLLTGYEEEEIEKFPEVSTLQNYTDVIIAGRFKQNQLIQRGIRGSENKKYLFYSDLYSIEEFFFVPPVEIFLNDNGTIIITGIEPEILDDTF